MNITVEELKQEKASLETAIGNNVQVLVAEFIQKTGVGIRDLSFTNYYKVQSIEPVFMQAKVSLDIDL